MLSAISAFAARGASERAEPPVSWFYGDRTSKRAEEAVIKT
jgi:hypothetical protein